MAEKMTTARDITAPTFDLEWQGKLYHLKITNLTFAETESVYYDQYEIKKNFAQILEEMSQIGTLRSIMAYCYALLKTNGIKDDEEGGPITWAKYSSTFALTDLPSFRAVLMEKISDALPAKEEDAKKDPFPETPKA